MFLKYNFLCTILQFQMANLLGVLIRNTTVHPKLKFLGLADTLYVYEFSLRTCLNFM